MPHCLSTTTAPTMDMDADATVHFSKDFYKGVSPQCWDPMIHKEVNQDIGRALEIIRLSDKSSADPAALLDLELPLLLHILAR
jgi:hypothetical protein